MAHVLNPPATVWATNLDPGLNALEPFLESDPPCSVPALDTWPALRRYLLVGGSNHALSLPIPVTVVDADPVRTALAEDSLRVVAEILAATAARPSRPEPLLLALALAAAVDDDLTRRAALTALPRVARTGRDLFLFATFIQSLRGWGRGLRRAVGAWYNDRPGAELIEDMLTTPAHAGWRHADLLRLGHPKAPTLTHDAIYRWAVTGTVPHLVGTDPAEPRSAELLARLAAVSALADLHDAGLAARLIAAHRLPLATIPGHLRREATVWQAVVPNLPLPELLVALPEVASTRCLVAGNPLHKMVCHRLMATSGRDLDVVPALALLAARRAYEAGTNGSDRWDIDGQIVTTLQRAFDRFCSRAQLSDRSTGLRIPAEIAHGVRRTGELSSLDVAATLALVLSRSEGNIRIEVVGATTLPLRLPPTAGVDDAVAAIARLAARTGASEASSTLVTLATEMGSMKRLVRFTMGDTYSEIGSRDNPGVESVTVLGIDAELIETTFGLLQPDPGEVLF